jgi:phosphopantetheinyl transferase (holo-ACP synthase)
MKKKFIKKEPVYTAEKCKQLKKVGVFLGKNLNDREAVYCRNNIKRYSISTLATMFGVSESCVKRCVQGFTYKHLDDIAKPMQYGK